MPGAESAVLQVRVDEALRQAFQDVAQRRQTTTSAMLRQLVRDCVEESRRKEAERQSAVVAAQDDAGETMDILMEVQGLRRD